MAENAGPVQIPLYSENDSLIRKTFTLIQKTTKIETDWVSESGVILVPGGRAALQEVLRPLGMVKQDGSLWNMSCGVPEYLLGRDCCRRAYLRGEFLICGSMSDPDREYHLEYVCGTEEHAVQIQHVLQKAGLTARVVPRRKYFVVYLKESEDILDLLSRMGAHNALMSMENSRILKDIANDVNRRVNFETSNLVKTATAAEHQIEDIRYIETHGGLGRLPDSLRSAAELRTAHPDATLKELGEMCVPPVGKSGINHRLRRLSQIAASMR